MTNITTNQESPREIVEMDLDELYADAAKMDAERAAKEAHDDNEEWEDDDPRLMGWVDDRGRP